MRKPEEAVSKHGFRFKHSLGQNFIFDETLLKSLADAAEVTRSDDVLEIGPGGGSLTACLAARAHRVVALELDRELLPVLAEVLRDYPNASVVQGDAMKADLGALTRDAFGENASFLVVANLPYYITTPVLTRLLTEGLPIRRVAVMVQREVGEKMLAGPGEEAYGMLAVLCAYYAEVSEAARVPAACFTPRPKVDSSFMVLQMRKEPPVAVPSQALFFRVARAAFAMRRKTIRNNLQASLNLSREEADACLAAAKILPTVRGETLALEDFARIAWKVEEIKKK